MAEIKYIYKINYILLPKKYFGNPRYPRARLLNSRTGIFSVKIN